MFALTQNRNVPVAALPVTQQMTEMSISREDKITTPKTEEAETKLSPAPLKTLRSESGHSEQERDWEGKQSEAETDDTNNIIKKNSSEFY